MLATKAMIVNMTLGLITSFQLRFEHLLIHNVSHLSIFAELAPKKIKCKLFFVFEWTLSYNFWLLKNNFANNQETC